MSDEEVVLVEESLTTGGIELQRRVTRKGKKLKQELRFCLERNGVPIGETATWEFKPAEGKEDQYLNMLAVHWGMLKEECQDILRQGQEYYQAKTGEGTFNPLNPWMLNYLARLSKPLLDQQIPKGDFMAGIVDPQFFPVTVPAERRKAMRDAAFEMEHMSLDRFEVITSAIMDNELAARRGYQGHRLSQLGFEKGDDDLLLATGAKMDDPWMRDDDEEDDDAIDEMLSADEQGRDPTDDTRWRGQEPRVWALDDDDRTEWDILHDEDDDTVHDTMYDFTMRTMDFSNAANRLWQEAAEHINRGSNVPMVVNQEQLEHMKSDMDNAGEAYKSFVGKTGGRCPDNLEIDTIFDTYEDVLADMKILHDMASNPRELKLVIESGIHRERGEGGASLQAGQR